LGLRTEHGGTPVSTMGSQRRLLKGALAALFYAVLGLSTGVAGAAPPGTPQLVPNDPGYSAFSSPLEQIDAPALWAAVAGKPCTVKIAVLDAGVAANPDVPYGTVANFAPGSGDVAHGVEVNSVIDGIFNNGVGVAGLAPGCPVLPVRVLDANGSWTGSSLVPAITYAADQPGVRVINLSLWITAGPAPSSQLQAALQYAYSRGILLVLIAGNGTNNNFQGSGDPSANLLAADNPEAIRVGGVDVNGSLDPGSNHGASWVDIAAPFRMPVDQPDGSYSIGQGTSFAAPVVSAIAAEMFNLDPSLTPDQVKSLLMSSGAKQAGLDVACGCVVNSLNAIEAAAGYRPPPPLNLVVKVSGGGVVSGGSDSAISCGSGETQCPEIVANGDQVSLSAEPDDGYVFDGWSGAPGCGKAPNCSFTMTNDITATAIFSKVKVLLRIVKAGPGLITSAPVGITCGSRCSASFAWGTAVLLKATPAKGFAVSRWIGCKPAGKLKLSCTTAKLTKAATIRVVYVRTKAIKRK
jgi:uncharacterized repeat protein (TIGR02543 family)